MNFIAPNSQYFLCKFYIFVQVGQKQCEFGAFSLFGVDKMAKELYNESAETFSGSDKNF